MGLETQPGEDVEGQPARRSLPLRVVTRLLRPTAPALGVLHYVDTREPLACLTFDDGPTPDATIAYLDLLDQYGAKATFFCLGTHAARHPDLVQEVRARGHWVGIHGWDHQCLIADAPRDPLGAWRFRTDQVRRAAQALGPDEPWLFRPPYGHHNPAVVAAARVAGARSIGWSVAAMDWLGMSAEQMGRRVLSGLRPGSIVLFHDFVTGVEDPQRRDRSRSLAAVEMVLADSHQLSFVTIPELCAHGKSVGAVSAGRRSNPSG
jgi:peptidoglycan-N-acetylglucosamine deacetylase